MGINPRALSNYPSAAIVLAKVSSSVYATRFYAMIAQKAAVHEARCEESARYSGDVF